MDMALAIDESLFLADAWMGRRRIDRVGGAPPTRSKS
jgi:hypothetical protein